ncbi:hypothetical protein GCM10010129_43880 [Streptomyces fumigatiscleroticus]|nr:hypothetical protein GCM10010129_43880 [Streptomyces fumigatiscleroticus]
MSTTRAWLWTCSRIRGPGTESTTPRFGGRGGGITCCPQAPRTPRNLHCGLQAAI